MRKTSKDALKSFEPSAMQTAVLEHLTACGERGATDSEMQSALGLHAHTQCPRRIELVKAGFVCDSGLTRKTQSGRNAVVWIASEFAKREPAKQLEFSL